MFVFLLFIGLVNASLPKPPALTAAGALVTGQNFFYTVLKLVFNYL
jgi:hypothetical protein